MIYLSAYQLLKAIDKKEIEGKTEEKKILRCEEMLKNMTIEYKKQSIVIYHNNAVNKQLFGRIISLYTFPLFYSKYL